MACAAAAVFDVHVGTVGRSLVCGTICSGRVLMTDEQDWREKEKTVHTTQRAGCACGRIVLCMDIDPQVQDPR